MFAWSPSLIVEAVKIISPWGNTCNSF